MSLRAVVSTTEIAGGALILLASLAFFVRVAQLPHADPHGIAYLLPALAASLGVLWFMAGFALRGPGLRAWILHALALLWSVALLAWLRLL
jgi:hypothetical protein